MSIKQKVCKICHSAESEGEVLCYPCKCSGTIKYIHKNCLFLYINSSKKSYCTICKHEYVFKDIYKPGTPDKLPFNIILQGLFSTISSVVSKCLKHLLAIVVFISIFVTNGSVVLSLLIDDPFPFFSLQNCLWTMVMGVLVTPISYLHFHLYKSLGRFLRRMSNRRLVRIDSVNVMSSIASDAVSVTDMGSDVQARSILSQVSSNLNFGNRSTTGTVFNTINNETEQELSAREVSVISEVNETNGLSGSRSSSNHHSSEDSNISLTNEPNEDTHANDRSSLDFCFDFKFYLKCVSAMVIYYVFMSFSNMIKFEYFDLPFFVFLKRIYLYETSKKFILFYGFLVLSLFCVNSILTRYKSRTLKQIQVYLSIYHSIYLGFMYFIFILGTGAHYYFMVYINQQEAFLTLNSSLFYGYKSYISLFLHFAIGYIINYCSMKLLEIFKGKFRPGLLYFIAEPRSSTICFLYKLSEGGVMKNALRSIVSSFFNLLLWKIIFFAFSYYIRDITFVFCIRSITKLLFLFKILCLVSNSYYDFQCFLSWLSLHVIKPASKILGLSNFLFKDVMIVDKTNMKQFAWHPNKHKYFSPKRVLKRRKRPITSEDIEKYFNKDTDSNFSVFYMPRMYKLSFLMVIIVIFTVFLSFYTLLFYFSNQIVKFISLSRFIDNSDDMMFIIVSGLILKFSCILWSLRKIFFVPYDFLIELQVALKYQIIFIFSNFIFPLWGTFILLFLYSDFTLENIISPGATFIILFSSNYVINYIIDNFIFRRAIITYSLISILKRLYGLISFLTSSILLIALFKSFRYLSLFESSETPFILFASALLIFFYLRKFLYNKYLIFCTDLRKQHYLLDREVINHGN